MRAYAIIAALFLAGCGSSPTAPTPIPVPSRITVSGTLTDTVSGAILGTFSQEVAGLPALVNVSAPGHLPRLARVSSASPTVDLIPEAGFDLGFYRQLARNGHESPGSLEPLRLLTASPSIYLQRTGLSDATVAALEQAALAVIPALTGGRLQVAAWETGDLVRGVRNGWIVVELISDPAASCGRATIGAAAGHVWLNLGRPGCTRPLQDTFGHEIGHALGFWHTDDSAALMRPGRPASHNGLVSERERYHGAIAYARSSGNTDLDQDVLTSAILVPMIRD